MLNSINFDNKTGLVISKPDDY